MSVLDLISDAARRHGVPTSLAIAVAKRESNFNQSARGSSGEVGIMQLMEGTATDLGVNRFDARQNVEGGVRYLREQFDRFGDWATALMAYNGGPGNVQRGTVSDAARRYAREVSADAGDALVAPAPLALPRLTLARRSVGVDSGLGVPAIAGLALAAVAVWALLKR